MPTPQEKTQILQSKFLELGIRLASEVVRGDPDALFRWLQNRSTLSGDMLRRIETETAQLGGMVYVAAPEGPFEAQIRQEIDDIRSHMEEGIPSSCNTISGIGGDGESLYLVNSCGIPVSDAIETPEELEEMLAVLVGPRL